MQEIKIEKFQGPLDLLLQLIDQEELEITEISLSEIIEHFLEELEKIEQESEQDLADFLVIATKLVYLKSKQLLPYLYEEEEEEDLTDQLKMYKKFVDASVYIEKLWQNEKKSYGRVEPLQKQKEFVIPENALQDNLHKSFSDLLKRLKPVNPLPTAKVDHSVSVRDVINHLKGTLKKIKKFKFSELFKNSKNKTEVIISFLAVLDMIKSGEVYMKQTKAFDDFEVKRV